MATPAALVRRASYSHANLRVVNALDIHATVVLGFGVIAGGCDMKLVLGRLIGIIPIVGQLYGKCSTRNLIDSFWETLSFTVFATIPLWLIPVLGFLLFQSNRSMIEHAVDLADDGELFVYTAASLGPLFYIITKKYAEWEAEKHRLTISFPSGNAFLIFSLIVCIISGFGFAILRIPELKSDNLPVNHAGVIRFSLFLFASALTCLSCASAYRNSIEEFVAGAQINVDQDDFLAKWRERKNG